MTSNSPLERTHGPSLVVLSVAASIVAATVAQYWSSRSTQLASDALCWFWLLLFDKYSTSPCVKAGSLQSRAHKRAGSCCIIAAALALASLCSSENVISCIFLPMVTPILFFVEAWLSSPQQTLNTTHQIDLSSITITPWGLALISALGAGTLAFWNSPDWLTIALSIVEFVTLVTAYGTLLPKRRAATLRIVPYVDLGTDMTMLAPRVIGLLVTALVAQIAFVGFVPFHTDAILISVPKALAWLSLSHTAHHLSWTSAVTIRTFAFYTARSPFTQSFDIQALLHIVCAILSLGQTIAQVPRTFRHRRVLWACLALPLLPYLANRHAIHTAYSRAASFANTHEHPVEVLIKQAREDFGALLARQSKTYTDACHEYRRRYKVQPPSGFDKWYAFAKSHASPIIDDYDAMYQSLVPLWRLSGTDILKVMQQVQALPNNELWTCKAPTSTHKTLCSHKRRTFDRHLSKMLDDLMVDLRDQLPDVVFLVNHLDEPRVAFPSSPESSVTLETLSRTRTWDHLTEACDRDMQNDSTLSHSGHEFYGLPFVQNATLSKDLCTYSSYAHQHGMLQSPTTFPLIRGLIPVLSTGSISTMGDIPFPSPAYMEDEFRYDKHDPEWSKKKSKVYWAGSTSGGFAEDVRWNSFHRQRFVGLAQSLGENKHTYLADKRGLATRVTSSFLNSRLFDVAFTRIFQCANKACREQSFFYRIKGWADKDEALHSKLAFDLDGNGISGRWYKLVASKSAPLKQTLLREWHDERLVPWVHFIPVSLSMEELPEMVMYLTSTKQGEQLAKQIADRGRAWFSRGLRNVDRAIYMYRLLLELARLQDPGRPAYML